MCRLGRRAIAEVVRPHASAAWRIVFRVSYRLIRLADPLIRSAIALGWPPLDGIVRISVPGRATGRTRRTLLTLLHVEGAWYVGHPNGSAAWTVNAEAAGWIDVDPPGAAGPRFAVRRLPGGSERDAVIRATWTQQPFPANLLYRAAARHVTAVGVYFRLEPVPAAVARRSAE
jgi:hypothetical protein